MAAKRQPRTSFARLERKLDALAERLDGLNLNGSAPALRELAGATPSLLELSRRSAVILLLADAAPAILSPEMTDIRTNALEHMGVIKRFMDILPGIVSAHDARTEDQAFNAGLRKRVRKYLNPLRPLGAVFWVVGTGFLLAAGASLYQLLRALPSIHP